MAGEKMAKKMEEKCENCGGMCAICGVVSGVLVLAAGAALFMFGNASLDPRVSHMVGGGALALYGIGLIVHALRLCPLCR
ncbi:MAG: hypothetical protein AB1324_05650 [Candidatus Micrarchaeota archaeon]